MSYLTDMLSKIPVQFQKEWVEPSITINAPTASQEIMLNEDFTCSGIAPANRVNIIAISSVGDETILASALVVASTLFSKTDCQLPSTDFNIGESVTIRVEDYNDTSVYSEVSVTTKASITSLAVDPVSPETATDFEFSGDSDGIGTGETITLEYSDDEVAWSSLGTATVQANGSWSKTDCQIATADDYKLRARYGTEVYSELLDVTVASGTWIPDGSELYLFMDGTTNISKVPISPDYDLTGIDSGDITQTKNVSASSVSPNFGMSFTPDRKKLLIYKSDRNVYELTLTVAGDLSTIVATPSASVDLSANVSSASTSSFQISPDGKYMFIWANATFHRYTMSTAWDITTAGSHESLDLTGNRSCAISPDGTRIWYQDSSNQRIRQTTLNTAWSLTGGTTYENYFLLLGLYNFAQFRFSTDKRTVFFLCASSATQPTKLKYITGLNNDYDILGKAIGDVVSVDSTLDNTAFTFGV